MLFRSSRGHLQETTNGLLSFPFTIRNQFVTALSTLEGAKTLRREFLEYRRALYKEAAAAAGAYWVRCYVVGEKKDRADTWHFVVVVRRHKMDIDTRHSTL